MQTVHSRPSKCAPLQEEALQELARSELPAMLEVHSRLTVLYPEYAIAHLPSDSIQRSRPSHAPSSHNVGHSNHLGSKVDPSDVAESAPRTADAEGEGAQESDEAAPAVECAQFVGNATVYGDCFQWHLDADPSGTPSALPCTAGLPKTKRVHPGRQRFGASLVLCRHLLKSVISYKYATSFVTVDKPAQTFV